MVCCYVCKQTKMNNLGHVWIHCPDTDVDFYCEWPEESIDGSEERSDMIQLLF